VTVERPRVRDLSGQELSLPSWDRAVAEDWLGKWAMNLMLINVSTRKFRRAVRLPEGDVPAPAAAGVSKSAASRHFVALSAARMKEWVGADLSALDIMVVQIDGIHNAGKLIKGKKRHILVDTLGLLLHAIVHAADVQDRDGGLLLLATLFGKFPFLEKLFADSAYQGPIFADGLAEILPYLKTEIIKRSDRASGFVQLPKRWIVERTIAWLNRCRRLAKDWENLNCSGLAFLKLASIRLMLRKLCNP
jgi:transposase